MMVFATIKEDYSVSVPKYFLYLFKQKFFVNSRGIELFTKEWVPANGDVAGVVMYCHGYGDQCTYFFDGEASPPTYHFAPSSHKVTVSKGQTSQWSFLLLI
jgi:hypothetical protein